MIYLCLSNWDHFFIFNDFNVSLKKKLHWTMLENTTPVYVFLRFTVAVFHCTGTVIRAALDLSYYML